MKYLLTAVIVLFLASCKDEVNSVDNSSGNLISNPSFEENGNPTLSGWTVSGEVNFYQDAPPDGGKYSAGIDAVWGKPYYISTTIPLTRGRYVYSFTCWAKANRLSSDISLYLISDSLASISSEVISDTSWKSYNLTGIISAGLNDSMKIFLKGASSQLIASKTYYDNCSFKIK